MSYTIHLPGFNFSINNYFFETWSLIGVSGYPVV